MKKCTGIIIAVIAMVCAVQVAALAKAGVEKNAAAVESHIDKDQHPAVAGAESGHGGPELGTILPLWSVLPFAGILLSIALFPLLAPSFWHHHYPKVSAFWALVMAVPFVIIYKGVALHEIAHIYILD